MRKIQKNIGLIVGIIVLISCAKVDVPKGCMDITAANYDALAEEEADCTFENTTMPIFSNGAYSDWDGNDFVFLPCKGSFDIVDLGNEQNGMALVADAQGEFFGFFQTLNVHEGRYYGTENAKLHFSAMLTQDIPNDSVHVFIRGTEPETHANCFDVLISDRQLLQTNQLTNGQMTDISFGLQSFDNLFLQNVGVVAGFEFESTPFDTLMIINNVNWTNY